MKEITIGEYKISHSEINEDKIWIEHSSGEGGEFSKEDFEALVKEFTMKIFRYEKEKTFRSIFID